MSVALLIPLTITIGGTPTNADQPPTLSDSGATYGVRQLDTGAVVVAAGTAMPAVDGQVGQYAYTFAAAAEGVSYQASIQAVVGGRAYYFAKTLSAPLPIASGPCYLTVDQADAIAATLPFLVAYKAATADAKLPALQQATYDVDLAARWQGRKYGVVAGSTTIDPLRQELEFPRVAYESSSGFPRVSPSSIGNGRADVVWDYDFGNNVPVVPLSVLRAVLIQADSILLGDREARLNNQHDGLRDDTSGSLRETYAATPQPGLATGLCRRAWQEVRRYQLRSGRLV